MKPIVFFLYKSKSFGRCIFFTVAPISVLFASVFVVMCRTSLKHFYLLFHMFGVLF